MHGTSSSLTLRFAEEILQYVVCSRRTTVVLPSVLNTKNVINNRDLHLKDEEHNHGN